MRRSPQPNQRQGVILMVVLAMLALFAIVGLTFVLYAQNSHTRANNFSMAWQLPFRDTPTTGGTTPPPDVSPDLLFRWALGQLIYDVDYTSTGVQSAIRGHSMARTMYGYNNQD